MKWNEKKKKTTNKIFEIKMSENSHIIEIYKKKTDDAVFYCN